MKLTLVFIVVQFFSLRLFSCECPPLQSLTKEYCEEYALIFKGRIDSVGECDNKAVAFFYVDELYKGKSLPIIEVYFDCATSCQMSLEKGQEWIVYANYSRYATPEITFCSRSRKCFKNKESDYFIATYQLSFEEEAFALKNILGSKSVLQEETIQTGHRDLIKPKGYSKIILIVLSGILLYAAFIYFLFPKGGKK